MLSLQVGPLALPVHPLLMVAAWWTAAWLAQRLAPDGPSRSRAMADRAMTVGAITGVVAARAAFVATAWPAYADDPLDVLNLRDGGWMPWAGLAAALGVLAGFAWRYPRIRRALALAAAAGVALWAVLSTALGVHDRPRLPALSLTSVDGEPLSLGPDGRPAVINLWATWCAPCRAEMPLLAKAQQRHPQVRFVFVNHGEPGDVVQRWLAQQPYVLRNVALDPQRRVAAAAQTQGLPTTLFVDAEGRLVDRHFGALSGPSLDAFVERLR